MPAMHKYLETKKINKFPRLPLEGNIELTYRCNNNCRHCWLRIPSDSKEKKDELSFQEIIKIVDEAQSMGCRKWCISGGEPMLRPDFSEIFDYITSHSIPYSINTNGTLINHKIAKLMKRKGVKMVALYGATADVHDYTTRTGGSFEAAIGGIQYLKEAGAGFIVQLIPMKSNYHQFKDMIKLAESLNKSYRIGAPWLYLSAYRDKKINAEIRRQRLGPQEVVELDKPDLSFEETRRAQSSNCHHVAKSKYLFSSCANSRRTFFVDPYGKMAFCYYMRDPALRYDLRKGNFRQAWEEFIPSLAKRFKITKEYQDNCGSCDLRNDCRCCPVYAYLEHGNFSAKVEYLCEVAKENRNYKENWQTNHRRYYKIADLTIQVESDLPIKEDTFHPKFKKFEVKEPNGEMVNIRHHFSLPDLNGDNLGKEVYRKAPWAVYGNGNFWIYLGISPREEEKKLHRVAIFNRDHSRVRIYNAKENTFLKGGLHSLTLFPTDQILFARILADREGLYLHSCGINFKGKGLLFAGHSEAGKSTIANLFKGKAEILCDDRMIIRRHPEGFKIYGTWSHGDVPDVSSNSAPLAAILFLEKAKENRIIPLNDKKEITKRFLACLIKPFVTVDWWDKTFGLIEKIIAQTPCYVLEFDKSAKVVDELRKL